MSARRPTPRTPKRLPSDLGVATVCVLLILALGLFAWLGMEIAGPRLEEPAEELPAHVVRHDSMCATATYDGELIRWYVMTDPDFGIQYLVNDRGGCCVRLDAYGSPVGVSYEDEG